MVAKRNYTPLIGKTFGRWSVIGIRRDKVQAGRLPMFLWNGESC